MNDPMIEAGSAIDLDRRELLRRGAIVLGATALWSTPVVQTLGMRAAAAGTEDDPTEIVLCPDGESAPSNLVFRYEAAAATLANIETRRASGPAPGTWCATVLGGQSFQVPRKANPEMAFTIVTGEATESLTVHTSCSQELTIGQRFGSLTLVGGLNSEGDPVGTTNADVMAIPGECKSLPSTEQDEAEDLDDEDAESPEAEAEAAEQEKAEQEKAEPEPEKAQAAEQEKAEAEKKAAAEQEQGAAEKKAAAEQEQGAAEKKAAAEQEQGAAEKKAAAEREKAAAKREKAAAEAEQKAAAERKAAAAEREKAAAERKAAAAEKEKAAAEQADR
jgi:hypothetical protein